MTSSLQVDRRLPSRYLQPILKCMYVSQAYPQRNFGSKWTSLLLLSMTVDNQQPVTIGNTNPSWRNHVIDKHLPRCYQILFGKRVTFASIACKKKLSTRMHLHLSNLWNSSIINLVVYCTRLGNYWYNYLYVFSVSWSCSIVKQYQTLVLFYDN